MTVEYRPAKRENVPLLIGLAGGTGAGKTFSAMLIAKGIAGDARFAVLDTENGRARHYADDFDFDVAELKAPFRPDRYADAIEAADEAGYPVIVVDSMSHEWDGDGGCLDWQEEEFERLGSRNETKMLSWQAPKKGHRKMLTRLLQVRAHVILCLRAAERVEMAKEDGKTVVRPKRSLTGLDGWIPISEPRLPHELTCSLLMTADAPGFPKPIKLEARHRPMVPLDQPLSEDVGRALAEWAAGGEIGDVDALAEELRGLLEEIGAQEHVAKIDEHRQADSPAAFAAWLRQQIGRAREKANEADELEPAPAPVASADDDPEPQPEPAAQTSFQIPESVVAEAAAYVVPSGRVKDHTVEEISTMEGGPEWLRWAIDNPGRLHEDTSRAVETYVRARMPELLEKAVA